MTNSPNELPRLSAPAQRALAAAGIQTLQQLSLFSERQIKALHGIGPRALRTLRDALQAHGMSFRSDA